MLEIISEDLFLEEESHTYKLKSDSTINFTSCTTLVNYFFEPFDSIGIANDLTANHPLYQHLSPRELVATWEKVADDGTSIHKEISDYIVNGNFPELEKSLTAIEYFKEKSQQYSDKYSEIGIFSVEERIAGTIDLMMYDEKRGVFDLFDWKSSKRIEKASYKQRMGNHEITKDLMDCNFIHYSLQLSLYRYILEKYYNIPVDKLTVLHINGNNVEPHECNYLFSKVNQMVKAPRKPLELKYRQGITREFDD